MTSEQLFVLVIVVIVVAIIQVSKNRHRIKRVILDRLNISPEAEQRKPLEPKQPVTESEPKVLTAEEKSKAELERGFKSSSLIERNVHGKLTFLITCGISTKLISDAPIHNHWIVTIRTASGTTWKFCRPAPITIWISLSSNWTEPSTNSLTTKNSRVGVIKLNTSTCFLTMIQVAASSIYQWKWGLIDGGKIIPFHQTGQKHFCLVTGSTISSTSH